MHTRCSFVALPLLMVLPAKASAETFLGNEAAITAGSNAAVTRQGDAIWYNPAGLGGVVQNKLDVSATLISYRIYDVADLIRIDLPSGSYPLDGSSTEFVTLPSSLTFVRNLSPTVSFGFGLFVPQTNDILFKERFSGSEEALFEGVPFTFDGNFGLDSQTQGQTYVVGPTLGLALRDDLRIGASLFGVYESARSNSTLFAVARAIDSPTPLTNFYASNSFVQYRSVGLRGVFGLQWDITPAWHSSFVVRTPTGTFWESSELSFVTAVNDDAFAGGDAVSGFDASQVSAMAYETSLAYTGRDWWLGIGGELRPRTTDTRVDLQRATVWNLRVGGKLTLDETWTLGAGLYTDRSDASNLTELGQSKVDYYGVTAGVDVNEYLALADDGSLTLSSTIGLGYAIGVGEIAGWAYDPVADASQGVIRLTDATYHDLSLYFGSTFAF